jgi:hypothetical protein
MYATQPYIIDSIRSQLDGFSIGIYHIHSDNKYQNTMPFSRSSMIITKNQDSCDIIEAQILRDLDFSFVLRSKCNFQIGLFAFHPKYMNYDSIKRHYAQNRTLPQNCQNFYDMGIYDLDFNVMNLISNDDTHFVVKSKNLKFVFYYMKLNRKEHSDIYRKEGIMNDSDETLYYTSNPHIYIDLNDY